MLKYPTIDAFIKISEMSPQDPLVNYFIMISCLDKIASEDEVHNFSDYSNEEVDGFMENLSSSVIKLIQTFFETMPKLRHEFKYKNSKGNDISISIQQPVQNIYADGIDNDKVKLLEINQNNKQREWTEIQIVK